MYRGEADWSAIARAVTLAHGTGVLLLGNGDLQSMEDVIRRVRDTGVDGVLVGRGALGSPWFFRDKDAARACLQTPNGHKDVGLPMSIEMERAQRFRIMVLHARQFESTLGIHRFPRMRKHLGWYCKGFPHAAALRASMVRASSVVDVERILETYMSAQRPCAEAPLASLGTTSSPLSCA
jgi:tRNA-dihydrouridine synthase